MELSNNPTELHALIYTLLARIDVLEACALQVAAKVKELELENTSLRVQLGMDSKNSHKPPSTDIFPKKAAIPVAKGKKKGGQEGHKGNTLKMAETPDFIVVHSPQVCSCCNRNILAQECELLPSKRQVFDIPVPRLEVTEHQVSSVVCCGIRQYGAFPEQVNANVQYGNRILTLSTLLSTDFRLPFRKISSLFETLFGYKFNVATAISANEASFEALASVEAEIKTRILASSVVHFDETGLKAEGKRQWMHTACTEAFCFLFLHVGRGKKALTDIMSVLKDYKNWAVHDCYGTYFTFKDCKHAVCNAHILRELEALKEQNSVWATAMHDFLMTLYNQTDKGTKIFIGIEDTAMVKARYGQICRQALQEEPYNTIKTRGKNGLPNGKLKQSKGRNLLERLIKHQEAVLAFAFVEDVPFTNNLAEQAIRNVKIKQKIAVFRTQRGAEMYARIQGFINTVKKHAKNVFQELLKVNTNQPICWENT